MILAGDVGGTKTALALFKPSAQQLRLVRADTFASAKHPSLESILGEFLAKQGRPRLRAACLGVAGPVVDEGCRLTNLDWSFDERTVARVLGTARVRLINDLAALAYGVHHLTSEDLSTLNQGTARRGANVAVLAAGTGLGEAMLYWDGHFYQALASEGGHCDFAPRTEVEMALLGALQAQYGHVSYERILTGSGLLNVYKFLRQRAATAEPAWLTEKLLAGDPGAVIAATALAGEDAACSEALALFASIYGAEAGNWALKCLALGGVFVGGGIAPKVLPLLQRDDVFMRSFTDKGRFHSLMQTIPVHVVVNPTAALLGSARYAMRL